MSLNKILINVKSSAVWDFYLRSPERVIQSIPDESRASWIPMQILEKASIRAYNLTKNYNLIQLFFYRPYEKLYTSMNFEPCFQPKESTVFLHMHTLLVINIWWEFILRNVARKIIQQNLMLNHIVHTLLLCSSLNCLTVILDTPCMTDHQK